MKVCNICKQEIKENEEYNDILGILSHNKCDKEYFEKQEKKIKYINSINL